MSGGHFGGLAIGDEFEWPPPWGPLGGKVDEILPLSDVVIRNAKPREKPFNMGDLLGLLCWFSRAAENYGGSKFASTAARRSLRWAFIRM